MNYMPRPTEANYNALFWSIYAIPTPSIATYKATSGDYVQLFYSHLQKWRSETYYSSSATELQEHPSFKAIVKLGKRVIPLVLDDLRRQPSLLILALHKITGESVVQDADRGNMRAMANAWLLWGERSGY